MSEYKHGSMNIEAKEQTFGGFISWSIRIAVLSIAALIFMAVFNS